MTDGRRARVSFPVLGIALPLLALSGCAAITPTSVATNTYAGLPPAHTADAQIQLPGEPLIFWIEEGASISVTTWGSSACPAILTEVDTADAQTLDLQYLEATTYRDRGCTDDYAAHTSEIELPSDATGRPLTVTVSFDGEAPRASVVLD